tara:strand:+ start:1051 stop:1233 length:183 start_codon:yes stop_codon:yes gene_type:complete
MKPRQDAENLFKQGVNVNDVAEQLNLPNIIVEKWYDTYQYKIKNADEINNQVKKYLRKKL